MSVFYRVVGLSSAILLAGCAAPYTAVKASYDLAQSCCATLSDLKYQKLSDQRQTLVEIDDTSQVYQFDTGKSYVAAFELPARVAPYTLGLKSFALGDHIDSSHIFYPQVLILDAQHRVLAKHQLNGLRATSATFLETVAAKSWGLMIALDATAVIDTAAARYAVIYTTAQLAPRIGNLNAPFPYPRLYRRPGTRSIAPCLMKISPARVDSLCPASARAG